MEQHQDSKLIAIVSVDLSGYSRKMEFDEYGTHRAVMKCLSEVLIPMAAQHCGDLVKSTGDGALITFPNATNAVAGMTAFQRRMVGRIRNKSISRRLVFRVGIHMARAICEDGDLYGNGVNLAVRLQEAADPGSILVSQRVLDHLTDDDQTRFAYVGQKYLKNIKAPPRLYVWSEDQSPQARPFTWSSAIAAGVIFAICTTPLNTIFSIHSVHDREFPDQGIGIDPIRQSTDTRPSSIFHVDIQDVDEKTRDLYYQAWVHFGRQTNNDLAKAAKYLNQILLDNPDDDASHALLSAVYWSAWYNRWEMGVRLTASEALKKVGQHLERVKEPTTVSRMVASEMLTASGRHSEAINVAENAIAQEPNLAVGYYAKGLALIYSGNPAAAESHMRIANRLDPHSSRYLFGLGFAQFSMDKLEAAILTLKRTIDLNSKDDWAYLLLAASSSMLGRHEEARTAIDRFNELGMSRRGWVSNHLLYVHSWPFKNQGDLRRLQRGVRLATRGPSHQIASR